MSPSSLQPSQLRWHRPLTDADRSPVELPSVRSPETTSSYGQILTSSAVIGGSSLVTMLAALVRNKFVAVFLGPAGVGLMSLFGAMTGVVGSFAGLGISTSGVREISEAAGAGDRIRLARSVTVVRRVVARLGLLGAALLAAFCRPISRLTFGSADHARDVLLLSAVVLASAIADGQVTRLQGFRRMGDLARAAVLGTILTLALTLPIVYFWRQDAVVALLLVASGATLVSSWWFARKIPIPPIEMTWRETLHAARPLLHLGSPRCLPR